MKTKLIIALGVFFLMNVASMAQSNIRITDGKQEENKCPEVKIEWYATAYNLTLNNKFIYLNVTKDRSQRDFSFSVRDNNTCETKVAKPIAAVTYTNGFEFIKSPKAKTALMVTKDQLYNPKEFIAINEDAEELWRYEWKLKSGDVELVVMNVKIDDEGNASFFVKAEDKKQGNAYAFIYRDAEDGKFKTIGYALDVNGRVTFRNEFDEWGNIHFMGAFERKDTKETGETKRGIFHGKVNPKEEDKLVTTLYPFQELKKYDSEWKLNNYIIDDNGNITLCALGQYKKGGAGRDFTKLFIIQLDENGKEKWSHLITTINLLKESAALGEGKFQKLGDNYAYIYYDNAEYIKYTDGIDVETLSSEPKQDDVQMYVVDAGGKLNKYSIGPKNNFAKYGVSVTETPDAIYVSGDKGSKKITW